MTFRIQTKTDKKRELSSLSGQTDHEASPELKMLIDEHTNGHRSIVDLGDIQLIDGSAVRYLAFCESKRDKALKLSEICS